MSIDDRRQQIEKLQDLVSKGKDIDVAAEFDQLVDYLQDHGYDIVKRDYPETTEEKIQKHTEALFESDSPRSPKEIEESIKDMCKRLKVEPEDAMHIWKSQMREQMDRATSSGRTADFAELLEYIKVGHSLINQTQRDE